MEIVGYNFAQKHVMKNVARADRLGYVINSSLDYVKTDLIKSK